MPHQLIKALRDYYSENGIAADNFSCPHAPECSAKAGEDFTTAREPGLGVKYLSRELPRLCMVSLDPGRLDEPSPLTVRQEPADVDQWDANRHWPQTHVLASELLQVFDPDVGPDEAALYFAHTNAVRCCENRPGGKQARWTLYENCQPYLRRELEILSPDIVVTQGKNARWSVRASFEDDEVEEAEEGDVTYWFLPLGDQKRAPWFHTHHPRYGGYWTQKEEQWPVYQDVLRRELSGFDGT